jgi:hypothetical protein
MRVIKAILALHVCTCGLAFGCLIFPARAAEDRLPPQTAGAANSAEQEEPTVSFATEGDFFLGYRWVDTHDSLKAAEYIYPHSSLSLGLDLLSCPLPYRYHANVEIVSKYDFYTDAGFAYKDRILFRDILVGVHHNLDHFPYQFAGEPPGLNYVERNAGERYAVDSVNNLLSLRLKAPDFPFHTFVNHRHIEKDGTVQQRFLLGDFNLLNKVSESRAIDWRSDAVTIGANSHLGPVEIEYAFDRAEFDPGTGNILYDSYVSGEIPPPRPNDTYPHNVFPKTESWGHSVKMHSSYTGGIVTAATLSNLTQKNNYSQTESSTWKGAFDFSWIPYPVLGLFFKYRRTDMDMDTPAMVTLSGLHNPPITYPVRQGISYDKDVFSLSSRYKPLHFLSLFTSYEFSHLHREATADWIVLPETTDIHTFDLTARIRPLDRIRLAAEYEFKKYNQPAYNTSPDRAHTLRVTTTYTPTATVNLYLEYTLGLTERDALRYLNSSPAVLIEDGTRDGRNHQFLASLTKSLTPTLSLTGSWYYQRWRIKQDLAYGKWLGANGDLPYRDSNVPCNDRTNSFALSLSYMPRADFTATADLTHTITKGTTGYTDVVGGAPFSLATFSDLKASETNLSVDLAKKLSQKWQVGLRSYLNIYNDREADLLDGDVFVTTFTLKRYF